MKKFHVFASLETKSDGNLPFPGESEKIFKTGGDFETGSNPGLLANSEFFLGKKTNLGKVSQPNGMPKTDSVPGSELLGFHNSLLSGGKGKNCENFSTEFLPTLASSGIPEQEIQLSLKSSSQNENFLPGNENENILINLVVVVILSKLSGSAVSFLKGKPELSEFKKIQGESQFTPTQIVLIERNQFFDKSLSPIQVGEFLERQGLKLVSNPRVDSVVDKNVLLKTKETPVQTFPAPGEPSLMAKVKTKVRRLVQRVPLQIQAAKHQSYDNAKADCAASKLLRQDQQSLLDMFNRPGFYLHGENGENTASIVYIGIGGGQTSRGPILQSVGGRGQQELNLLRSDAIRLQETRPERIRHRRITINGSQWLNISTRNGIKRESQLDIQDVIDNLVTGTRPVIDPYYKLSIHNKKLLIAFLSVWQHYYSSRWRNHWLFKPFPMEPDVERDQLVNFETRAIHNTLENGLIEGQTIKSLTAGFITGLYLLGNDSQFPPGWDPAPDQFAADWQMASIEDIRRINIYFTQVSFNRCIHKWKVNSFPKILELTRRRAARAARLQAAQTPQERVQRAREQAAQARQAAEALQQQIQQTQQQLQQTQALQQAGQELQETQQQLQQAQEQLEQLCLEKADVAEQVEDGTLQLRALRQQIHQAQQELDQLHQAQQELDQLQQTQEQVQQISQELEELQQIQQAQEVQEQGEE